MEGGRFVVFLDELGCIFKFCRIVYVLGMCLNFYYDFVKEFFCMFCLFYSLDMVCVVNIIVSMLFMLGVYVCSCIFIKCVYFYVWIYVIVEFENGCFDIVLWRYYYRCKNCL